MKVKQLMKILFVDYDVNLIIDGKHTICVDKKLGEKSIKNIHIFDNGVVTIQTKEEKQ